MSILNVRLDKPCIALVAVLSGVCESVSAFTTWAYEVVALAIFFWLERLIGNI